MKNYPDFPIKAPQKIEVVLEIRMTNKRMKLVDIDNLTKSVLDCLNGIIFDDDSQVINILAGKHTHQKGPSNGLLIGVRKINGDCSNSWFREVNLGGFVYKETNTQ